MSAPAPGPRVPQVSQARRPQPLTVEETVAGARALLDAEGIEGFSMRKLASVLGVSPMTIYLRFDNKEQLLAAVGQQILGAIELPTASGPWQDQAMAFVVALHRQLLAARHAELVLHGAADYPALVARIADRGLEIMELAGFRGPDAVEAFRVLFWHALTYALANEAIGSVTDDVRVRALEPTGTDLPTYRAMVPYFTSLEPESLFEVASRRLVDGLEVAATRSGS